MTDMGRKAWSDPARAAPRLARMAIGRFLEVDEIAVSPSPFSLSS
jgi:hypothetical protein